ncbi:MAG: NAD(P)-binding domain-containing protein [Opitutaceae bacterium]|nr:NAD(P)-binding domain-containing protein [Opitutaceae bacterium]
MNLKLTSRFPGDATIGLFGAGHLGRAIAQGLLEAGLPQRNLAICHRGSTETDRALSDAGLAEVVASSEQVARRSRILLYLVRPQDYLAIRGFELRKDCLLISFLAGVPLQNLPANVGAAQRARAMTSAPDTLRQRDGLAALYPADNLLARELFESLHLQIIPLRRESDFHAFTALGPCLPIALTQWKGLGHEIDDAELRQTAERFELPDYDSILQWAHRVRPRRLSDAERKHYLAQAATPGGVTEAILHALAAGTNLSAALEQGIKRSRELATG